MSQKSKFNLDTMKAVSERSAQKMTITNEQSVQKIKNPKGAGRKPAIEKAINKISLNLTNTELEKFNEFCTQNGMTIAIAIRYCLTKQNAL